MPKGWFIYIGSPADRTLAGSYVYAGQDPFLDFECIGSGESCAIYADYFGAPFPGSSNPFAPLSFAIQTYINISLAFSINMPPFGRTYLYVKSP